MKKRNATSLVFALAMLLVFAGSAAAEFEWGAKYAGDFLTGQSNARLLALGGAGVAISSGPSAIHANPALLHIEPRNGISLMHADRFSGVVRVDHAAWVRRDGEGRTVGIGLIRQGVDDIPVTVLQNPSLPPGSDNRVRVIDYTSASDYAFQFALAMEQPYGRIGATAKLIYRRLYETNGFGLGFDLGYARSFGNLTLGAQLRDAITTLIAWDTGRQEGIAPTARIGAAYHLILPKQLADIIPVAEVEFRGESLGDPDAIAVHAGLEYCVNHVVAARVGVDDRRLTYGAGLHVGPVQLDYAFVGHDDLGSTHRVSVQVVFGE